MSLFGDIWRGVTGPVRFVGNLARGKVRKAIGSLGDTAKIGAAVLGATGVGLPVAAGVGALGGAASKWGRGESNIGRLALGGLEGAGYGAAGTAGRALFAGAPSTGTVVGGERLVPSVIEEGGALVTQAAPKVSLAARVGAGLKTGATNIGRFAAKNPELTLGLAQTGLQGYAGGQQARIAEREQQLEEQRQRALEEERERQFRLGQMQTILGTMAQFRPRYSTSY